MIYILSWTTKKHQKNLSRPLHSKFKKIYGLFKEKWNSRTFQGLPLKFNDFSSVGKPCIKQAKTYQDGDCLTKYIRKTSLSGFFYQV